MVKGWVVTTCYVMDKQGSCMTLVFQLAVLTWKFSDTWSTVKIRNSFFWQSKLIP
jgi:hypothetical protein